MKNRLLNLAAAWQLGQPIVPCDGIENCDWKALFQLFSNLLSFFIYISAFVAGLGSAVAGVMFLLGSTNPGKREEAKKLLRRILIGFVAVLAAALIIKTIINALVKPESGLQISSFLTVNYYA